MRSLLASAVVGALLVTAGAVATASPATAATTGVTVHKIPTKTAPYHGKVTVKPVVTSRGHAVVSKKLLSVKEGSKTVASKKTSVKLAAGTYKVFSRAYYRTYTTRTATKKVTTRKVGVALGTDVRVTCRATSVRDEGWGWVDVAAACTSPRFDGTRHVVLGLSQDGSSWWGMADDFDELTVSHVPTAGASFAAVLNPGANLRKTTTTTRKVTVKLWSKTKLRTLAQTLVVKQKARPNHTSPISTWDCPSWAPIKGNASSHIYHVPGGRWYDVTTPEICFTTTAAARAYGYRASKNG